MRLSILILTHKRPELFQRCLESARKQLCDDVEIIINNDSNDISIDSYHPNISYYFNKFENLSQIYEFLLHKAQGEYVYFLEDDDYLTDDFLKIELDAELICGNYCPTYEPNDILKYLKTYNDNIISSEQFLDTLNIDDLQLSQFIFKKDTIEDFVFPNDNNIHNDINLVMHALTRIDNVKTINKVLFYQTTDGGDNISFPHTNASIDIIQSLDFMRNYKK